MINKPPSQKRSWLIPAILIGSFSFLLVCCTCLVVIGATLSYLQPRLKGSSNLASIFKPSPTVMVIRPTQDVDLPPNLTPTPGVSFPDNPSEVIVSSETVENITNTIVPTSDPIRLAQQLEGKGAIPASLEPTAEIFEPGAQKKFWLTNSDTNENFQVDATLRYVTDHSYFWIENGVDFNSNDLANLANTFETKIYPTNREFFGSEWTPGVDGDPHIYILFGRELGSSIAGYYSSKDEYLPMASEFSNAHEMFIFSADTTSLEEEFTYAVLAHEFQHMIHWFTDRNEEGWVNEGFAELAAFLNGYGVGFHDFSYIEDPDIQLNSWPDGDTGPHYGAAFLFLNYFLNRFGEELTKAVVASPFNGLDSIDRILKENNITDPLNNLPIVANDVFADWVLASFLKDSSIDDGRYTYDNYFLAPQAVETETISTCPSQVQTRDVSQYGVDYIQFTCLGDNILRFEGSILAPLLPVEPYSGDYYLWSNRGDESSMTLTRKFDFQDHSGLLNFHYWTWYDLEKDYDYLYLEASIDGGETWDILITPSGTAEDPSGNSYGWGYNGLSGNPDGTESKGAQWIQEKVDISKYAGKEVLLRFQYVTDAAVNGEGLVVDNIEIPEINYFNDLETDLGGWEAEGFVRIQNIIPQTYRLSLISKGEQTKVEKFSLSGNNILEIPISIGDQTDEVVLVVSGTAPYTRQKAAYQFVVSP